MTRVTSKRSRRRCSFAGSLRQLHTVLASRRFSHSMTASRRGPSVRSGCSRVAVWQHTL